MPIFTGMTVRVARTFHDGRGSRQPADGLGFVTSHHWSTRNRL